ncbi:response regulator [Rufibacter roseus]|uniref:Response regulator n=1 Tax=Rufibacter roseus TaxID=1567108 RepID=A0ABW2DP89_9BACT|nr:response regulator [Rufibacter roseus]
MPLMDGFDFMETLNKLNLHSKTTVVVVTSSSNEEDRAKATSLGAKGFFTKPLDKVELSLLLDSLYEYED